MNQLELRSPDLKGQGSNLELVRWDIAIQDTKTAIGQRPHYAFRCI